MATGVAKTTYLSDALLNEVLRAINFAAPATVYLALFTVTPGEAGGGTEVAGGAYARQAAAFTAPGPSANGREVSNSGDIFFPVATANWGIIVAVAIMDAAAAGNMLYYGALAANKTINNTDQFVMRAGQLVIAED